MTLAVEGIKSVKSIERRCIYLFLSFPYSIFHPHDDATIFYNSGTSLCKVTDKLLAQIIRLVHSFNRTQILNLATFLGQSHPRARAF